MASEHDPRIESETKKSHVFSKLLKGGNLEAQSLDGVVTLTGTVDLEAQRQLAQATATGVQGVKGVENKIVVAKGSVDNIDTGLFMKLTSTLACHRSASAAGTTVEVKNGVVLIKGKAANEAQRTLMTEYTKDIVEVKDVKNEMTVASDGNPVASMVATIDDASIAAQIQMVLLARRSTNLLTPTVTSLDGVVTLSGNAKTMAERNHVETLVLDVNGVNKVVNNMTVKQDSGASN